MKVEYEFDFDKMFPDESYRMFFDMVVQHLMKDRNLTQTDAEHMTLRGVFLAGLHSFMDGKYGDPPSNA